MYSFSRVVSSPAIGSGLAPALCSLVFGPVRSIRVVRSAVAERVPVRRAVRRCSRMSAGLLIYTEAAGWSWSERGAACEVGVAAPSAVSRMAAAPRAADRGAMERMRRMRRIG